MDDLEIVALYWARNEEAISASETKYGGFCRTISHNILASWEDAEECTNDTWGRAWNTMPPQRPGSLRAYLGRIVRNLSLDRWRAAHSQKRGRGMEQLSLELEDCLPHSPSAEELTEVRETAACIDRWLDTLSEGDRALFLLRYWYGVEVQELAKRWGKGANPMAQHLRRLRLGLREALEKEGVAV